MYHPIVKGAKQNFSVGDKLEPAWGPPEVRMNTGRWKRNRRSASCCRNVVVRQDAAGTGRVEFMG
jgi:hypothetical protein